MPEVARIGDTGVGTCCCHPPIPCIGMTGVVASGAGTVNAESSNVARLGDIVLGNCGHTGIIVSSSGTVTAEGALIARLGDSFTGCFSGTIVTGAGTVINSA